MSVYTIPSRKAPYSRRIEVKTLCQMDIVKQFGGYTWTYTPEDTYIVKAYAEQFYPEATLTHRCNG